MKTIDIPTLILDEKKCIRNIQRMADKARRHNLHFRPHFKTHQSLEIGGWFKEEGVNSITVSSLLMAEYFSTEWDDITVAFPVNPRETDRLNALAGKIKVNILIESAEVVALLHEKLKWTVGFFVKIDTGSHRTGLQPDDYTTINEILRLSSTGSLLQFKGFLSHAGHTYHAKSKEEILNIHQQELRQMQTLKGHYVNQWPELLLSVGDTPSCSIADDFSGMDEIRPGNFVFYDLMQSQLGVCEPEDIAVAVACPVAARHPERNEIVVYGGAVHLSKDHLQQWPEGDIYGCVALPENNGWGKLINDLSVTRLSQEHGIVSVPEQFFQEIHIGDLLFILPVHSCLTADMYCSYTATNGRKIKKTRSI